MILTCEQRLDIGRRCDFGSVSDRDGRKHRMPFVVLRAATEAEHLAYVREQGVMPKVRPGDFFYEVSLD